MEKNFFQNILLVTGPARSGTSAFISLLNSHSSFCLGNERYRWVFAKHYNNEPQLEFGKDLFTSKRFFDYRNSDSHMGKKISQGRIEPPSEDYRELFANARFVGDKIPNAIHDYVDLIKRFPSAFVVFMARKIEHVAFSWNQRGLEKKASWTLDKDYKAAVKEYNTQFRSILMAKRIEPNRVIIMDYDKIFGDSHKVFESFINEINNTECNSQDVWGNWRAEVHDQIESIRSKDRSLPTEELDYINSHVDKQTADKVFSLAL